VFGISLGIVWKVLPVVSGFMYHGDGHSHIKICQQVEKSGSNLLQWDSFALSFSRGGAHYPGFSAPAAFMHLAGAAHPAKDNKCSPHHDCSFCMFYPKILIALALKY
jgi:hypothetical protein